MPHDVVSLGEALVDFLPDEAGRRVRDVTRWTPCTGGAPANVVVGLARLGARSALIGVTGEDEFGHFLKQGLAREGVDVRHLRQTAEGRTGLGFVSLTPTGERSFVFYRVRSAETFLGPQDTRGAAATIAAARVLHVGTNSLLRPRARRAVLEAVAGRRRAGQLVSCDPNLRLHLWPRPALLRGLLRRLLPGCAVVKLSHEEIRFVCGTSRPERALQVLEGLGVPLAVVTLAGEGAVLRFRGQVLRVPAPKVRVKDTTGAGDGFMAGLLYALTRQVRSRAQLEALDVAAVEQAARLGCAVGSRVVTALGAITALPTAAQARSARLPLFRS